MLLQNDQHPPTLLNAALPGLFQDWLILPHVGSSLTWLKIFIQTLSSKLSDTKFISVENSFVLQKRVYVLVYKKFQDKNKSFFKENEAVHLVIAVR